MNDNLNSDDNSHYANVLASLTQDSENCISASPLHSEPFETEFVEVDDLSIMPSNSEISSKLATRLLTTDLNVITTSSKSDTILQNNCIINAPTHVIKNSISRQPKHIKSKVVTQDHVLKKQHSSTLVAKFNNINENGINNSHPSVPSSNNDNIPSSNNDINSFVTFCLQKFPQQSTNNTAVEQLNMGPCSCFLCGQILNDPGERYMYLNNQKLFGMKISLLELLSSIINQTVLTNTESVDLCQKCSELMNEADMTFKRLHDLREEINSLFTINKRPKLTFQILPKPPSSLIPKNFVIKDNDTDHLAELVSSRPRRGRGARKKMSKDIIGKKVEETTENEKTVKKKGGRPRKPFQCHICRRKFFAHSSVEKHLFKEHNVSPSLSSNIPSSSSNDNLNLTIKSFTSSSIDKNSSLMSVKVEGTDERETLTNKCNIFERENKMQNIIITHEEQETTYPSHSKSSILETFSSGGINSSVRPIQPKPQTLVQTAVDGSLIFLMNPTAGEAAPALIKVSPGYLNLKNGNHTCEICQKTFLDDKGYRMHKIAAHGTRKKKLDSDGSSDGNSNAIDEVDSFHKMWQCDACTFVFFSKNDLLEHRKSFHGKSINEDSQNEQRKEKTYSCSECDLTFNYKYELEKHRESHIPFHKVGPHEFICCICGLKVASKAALKIHIHRFHTKESETKDFLCSECGHMTSTKKSFADHLRIHSDIPGQKKVCHLCKKEMLSSSFKIHMIRMHGEAKHPCDLCGQRFTLRSVLMKHLNTIHSTLTPYDCSLCSKKFVTAEALRYHKNKLHSSGIHCCVRCGKIFKWKGDLRVHINKVHNAGRTRHQCVVCSRSYSDRRKLEHHVTLKHTNLSTDPSLNKEKEAGSPNCTEQKITFGTEETGVLSSEPQEVIVSLPCSSSVTQGPHEVHLISDTTDNFASLNDFGEDNNTSAVASIQAAHVDLQREYIERVAVSTLSLDQYQPSHPHHIYVSTSQNEVLTSSINSSFVQSHSKLQHQPLTDHQMQSMYLVSDISMDNDDKDS